MNTAFRHFMSPSSMFGSIFEVLFWTFGHLPVPAWPIPGRKFGFSRATLMSGTEWFTSFRVRFLNEHIAVTKTDDLFSSILTGFHDKLLWPIRSTPRFIAFHFGFVDCHCSDYKVHKHSFSEFVSPLTHSIIASSINMPLFFCPSFPNALQVFEMVNQNRRRNVCWFYSS